jgi:hypothetical protein
MIPLLLALLGCSERRSCEDIGEAIAVRTWDCTGDAELGYARAERLQFASTCSIDPGDPVVPESCTQEIEDLGCDRVDALGDDPFDWLAAAPDCSGAFVE